MVMTDAQIQKSLDDVHKINATIIELDRAIDGLQAFKAGGRFTPTDIDKQMAYFKEVQNYVFSQLNGLKY